MMVKFMRLGAVIVAVISLLGGCAQKTSAPANRIPPPPPSQAVLSPPPLIASALAENRPQEFIMGTGRFVGTPGHSAEPAQIVGEVTLNFQDADIRDVARAVFGDILGMNYIVAPNVQGTTTVRTIQPIPKSQVIPVLESVLKLSGVALVQGESMISLMPLSEAGRESRLRVGRKAVPGWAAQVVPLSYISADEMLRLMESVGPTTGVVKIDQARNILILSGTDRERQAMLDVVAAFDVDWLVGMSYAMLPLKVASAKTVTTELWQVLGGQEGPLGRLIRLVPLERINTLLAISTQERYLQQVATWVQRLDRENDREERRIHVYHVQNGKAAEIAESVGKLYGSDVGKKGPSGEAAPESGEKPAGKSDAPVVSGEKGIKIIADEANNSLLILATPFEYAGIEAALRKIDTMPLQVLIEAVIAEVTITDELRYGLQYFFQNGNFSLVRTNSSTATVAPTLPGFSSVYTTSSNIKVVLDALESVTNVKVLSSPQLMVVNNRTANLQVGDQVPIATQSAVGVLAAGAPVVNTIQFRDTGVMLKVTPRVNDSGIVHLDVTQEVSDVTRTTTSNLDSPTIQQRKVTSSVVIGDGETLALGGLIRDGSDNGNSGVPGLHQVPVLGFLFGTKSETIRRTELLVLITPKVIRRADDARDVGNELLNRMRSLPPIQSLAPRS